MTEPHKLLHWLDAERESQLDFLQQFARVDTANPPGDTRRAADLFRAFLDREGIAHRTEAPQAAHPNLIATFAGGAGSGRHLVLNGHLDVFPVGDRAAWARDPWSGEIADGRVHGRGTVDMKCGTTALLFVFAYLYRLRAGLPGRVTLTVVSDEETGGKWGTAWLIENCAREVLGDCVLNTEPSGLATVRFGEKCMLWLRFHIAVKGGHSAYPHTGGSANKVAAALIHDLQAIDAMVPDEPATVRATLDRPEVARAADLSLGAGAAQVMRRVSVNIGTMQGGVKINMLPAECVVEVDPPPRRHQPRRGAGAGRGDRRAPSRHQLRGAAARRPGSHRLRSNARDDGPSPAPRRLGPRRAAAADHKPRRHRHPLLADQGRARLRLRLFARRHGRRR
ncbi:MAG: succinyl-diaminopimelate desuccinylase [Rhodospirillaceae bacterium]|nr:succinyl-diaminopimelate desuccinylase [Rhodospirillaceae bacterium]